MCYLKLLVIATSIQLALMLQASQGHEGHSYGNLSSSHSSIEEVPKNFMDLVNDYIAISFDHSHLGGDSSLYEDNQAKARAVLNNIRDKYPDDFEKYFTLIAEKGNSPVLRKSAYYMHRKMNAGSDSMLKYSRNQLRSRNWEDGIHMSSDIHNQLRVLAQYGDKSDLELWEEIWARMDEREQHTFKNYRKILVGTLENKDDPVRLRAARGDNEAENKLLGKKPEQEKPSVFLQNKQILVGGVVLVILVLVYVVLNLKNKKLAN